MSAARQMLTRSSWRAALPSLSPSPSMSRHFGAAAARWAGKEDKLHTEGRAEEVEARKHESLREQKEGRGEWKEDLGSSSESIIKAERNETKTTKETIAQLQEEAKKVGRK